MKENEDIHSIVLDISNEEISEERLNESLVRIIKVKQGIAGESN
jgi:hypothetical protein